jgi:hypothetical protein
MPLPLGAPWPAGGGAGVADAAGVGFAQVAGEGRPCWRLLTLIALTRVSNRVVAALARAFFRQNRGTEQTK